MFSIGNKRGEGSQARELQRLRRQDLLELLLEQMGEADSLAGELSASQARVAELEALCGRLRDRLDEKDALIERLKARLDLKDRIIAAQVARGRAVPADLAQAAELLESEWRALEASISAAAAGPADPRPRGAHAAHAAPRGVARDA